MSSRYVRVCERRSAWKGETRVVITITLLFVPLFLPRLYISRRNSQRAIRLPKIQPPLPFELHQPLRKHNPIHLPLRLLRRTRPKERPLQPRHRPICQLMLIGPTNNWVLNTSIDGRAERAGRIDQHLTNGVLALRVSDASRSHGIVDEEPVAVAGLDGCRTWLEEAVLPWVDGRCERLA